MKHLNFKITIIILGVIATGLFSTTYVKAGNIGENGEFIPTFVAPAPESVVVSDITASSAIISWEQPAANPSTTTYRIFSPPSETSLGETTNSSLQLNSLTPDTDYSLMVAPIETDGQIYASAPFAFHTLVDLPPTITNPTSLTTIASTSNSITLQWDTNNSATGTVYQISGNNFATTTATSTGIGMMSTVINLSAPDTQYTFNLQSQNIDSSLNPAISVSDYTKASDPINLVVTNVATSSLVLSWEANGNPDTTMYLVSDASSSLGVANTTTMNIGSLTPNTTYIFTVLSANNNNDNSPNTPVTPLTITTTTKSNEESNNDNNNNNNSGPSNTPISDSQINTMVNNILDLFKTKQGSDGQINDAGTSDWAAMTFGAKGIYASDIKSGEKSLYDFIYNYNFTDGTDPQHKCSAYPRNMLALLASGANTNNEKIVSLKNKINTECLISGKYGDPGIYDDVFGLIALLSVGESQDSPLVSVLIDDIKSSQKPDGSFDGWDVDITGAAINALKYAQEKGVTIDDTIFTSSTKYLTTKQVDDGGWGCSDFDNWPTCKLSDSINTGWVVMGINALKQTQTNWFNSKGKNPWYVLTSFDYNADLLFGTKHAVPALIGKSWPIILAPKSVPAPIVGVSGSPAPTVPTTTLDVLPTSTVSTSTTVTTTTNTSTISSGDISTSTPQISFTEITTEKLPTTTAQKTTTSIKKVVEKTIPVATETNETNLSAGKALVDKNQLVDELPLDTPTKRTVKKLFALSGGGMLAVGYFIARKTFRKVI